MFLNSSEQLTSSLSKSIALQASKLSWLKNTLMIIQLSKVFYQYKYQRMCTELPSQRGEKCLAHLLVGFLFLFIMQAMKIGICNYQTLCVFFIMYEINHWSKENKMCISILKRVEKSSKKRTSSRIFNHMCSNNCKRMNLQEIYKSNNSPWDDHHVMHQPWLGKYTNPIYLERKSIFLKISISRINQRPGLTDGSYTSIWDPFILLKMPKFYKL